MQTNNNLDNIIPKGVLFNLAQLQEHNILKTATAKKLIYAGKLEAIKMGLFIILCQLGKIKNTKGHKDENRNRCRAIC